MKNWGSNILFRRKKMAVSPVLASIIMIGVTVTGGMAVWAYVNSTSAGMTEAFGEGVANDINGLNEDFIITYLGINATSDEVTIWIYNFGKMDTNIEQVLIWSESNSTADIVIVDTLVQKGTAGVLDISYPIENDETYFVKAIGTYGSTDETYLRVN
jgi:archaellum component FlaF (FlaF/FlaG flagellin family)